MGANMVRRLLGGGHQCVVFDTSAQAVRALANEKAVGTTTVTEFTQKLTKPRAAWVMVPAGAPTESTVQELAGQMDRGDAIIDGGNSHYHDDIMNVGFVVS